MGIKKIYIFALAAHGLGLSGGDRIFIEFARRWSINNKVGIWIWQEGHALCKKQHLTSSKIAYFVSSMKPWRNFGFIINYFARIVEGIKIGLTINLDNNPNTVVYSASEFWMDSLPAFLLKLRCPKLKWMAAWYQTAPSPLKGFSEGKREDRYRTSGFLYWLMQLPIKPLIKGWADLILVNNEQEKRVFAQPNFEGRVRVVLGAVDIEGIEVWRRKLQKSPRVYDAVFQGRFHPQKGVLELIDIWKLVIKKKNNAKLVMIGDGPLMRDVKNKIEKEHLGKNIILKGFLFDSGEKYRIFAQSKIVIHPAFYDSGGMASAEAMAFGLPCIGFDLKSYKSYYPKGMIKVSIGNLREFANVIVSLLNDQFRRDRVGREGLDMIKKSWSWDKRAEEIFNEINR